MNVTFWNVQHLIPADFEEIPDTLKYFACAIHCNGSFWEDDHSITQFLTTETHREYWIKTFVAYVHSLFDTLNLWKLQVRYTFSVNNRITDVYY